MPEITNSIRKLVRSLSTLKGRRQENAFVVEGTKSVLDTIPYFTLTALFATPRWLESHPDFTGGNVYRASRADLERMSSLSTPPEVLAVYRLPEPKPFDLKKDRLYVALDAVQDPGNLGTIVRLCDWFGVTDILASTDTVDLFNPKAIMATMGSIGRVEVRYVDLAAVLNDARSIGLPVFGTFLDGRNIYESGLSSSGIIVMGNEGRGISETVASSVTDRLLIPTYPPGHAGAESLNVAMATAITLAEFRRPK